MFKDSSKDVLGISCGILKGEIEHLIAEGKLNIPFIFLDSALHVEPTKLHNALQKCVSHYSSEYRALLLIYGDCHAFMNEIEIDSKVIRAKCLNCCELLLGKEEYRTLSGVGSFYILHDWALNWEEIFKIKLGLNEAVASEVMRATHSELVYLDTGVHEVPIKILKDMSEYMGLPYRILLVSLDNILYSVQSILKGVVNINVE